MVHQQLRHRRLRMESDIGWYVSVKMETDGNMLFGHNFISIKYMKNGHKHSVFANVV